MIPYFNAGWQLKSLAMLSAPGILEIAERSN